MAYFEDPRQSVALITDMMVAKQWPKLATYYDPDALDVDLSVLNSGEYFIRKELPKVGHPAGFSRYIQPFSPGFIYQSHKLVGDNIIEITVQVEIDQGGGMIQRGHDIYHMTKSSAGYQLIPKQSRAPSQIDIPVTVAPKLNY